MTKMKPWALLIIVNGLAGLAGADELNQSFLDGQFDETTLRTIGSTERIAREPEGLRIAISKESGSAANTGISFPLQVAGDCSLQTTVRVVSLPQPAGGYGTGVAMLIEDGVSQGASLQRVKMPDGKEHYVAHHFVRDDAGKYKHEAKTFPTSATEVVLRMERRGSQLSYMVSEDEGKNFRKLTQFPFSSDPLKVTQVYGQTGGEPNSVEIVIQDFQLEGESFFRPGQKAPRGGSMIPWLAGALFVLIPLIGGIVWWSRRR